MMKRALITGAAGQDGTYLSDLLLAKGYEVYGVPGPFRADFDARVERSEGRLIGIDADLMDMESLLSALEISKPDEVYNFAAISSVGEAWSQAVASAEVNAVGVIRLLEAIRSAAPDARLFQASTAEIFGTDAPMPQTELTAQNPCSPYAIAKAYAHNMVRSYRDAHGMYGCNGILFNHESPLRGTQFVTRKITDGAVRCKLGLSSELRLGNLDAKRDWGYAGDYVEAFWLMLQQEVPDDFIVASGEVHTVRDFCEAAFSRLGLDYRDYVVVDPQFFRPVDPNILHGDPSRARAELGWEPKVSFRGLVEMMVDADLERLSGSGEAASDS